jgi:integrase
LILDYMSYACYQQDSHSAYGSMLLNGVAYLLPEAARHLPLSWKALQAWGKITISTEGGPIPLQTLACMESWLRQQKDAKALVAADAIPIAADCYLREQDIVNLRIEDVVFTSDALSCALLLGRSKRGESVKTGRDQGVIPDEPYSIEILRRRVANQPPSAKVFPITHAQYGEWWRKAAAALKVSPGPPHSSRHTGASRDLAEGYRDLDGIMRRGRWKALASVQRYAKTHSWLQALSSQPHHIQQEGNAILALRRPRPAVAKG